MNPNDEELMSKILQEEGERLRLRREEEERLRREEEERLRREEESKYEKYDNMRKIYSEYVIRGIMKHNNLPQADIDTYWGKIYEPRVFVPYVPHKDGNMKVNLSHRSRTIQTKKKSANKSKRKKKSKKRKSPKKH